jgi:hypothetical protein
MNGRPERGHANNRVTAKYGPSGKDRMPDPTHRGLWCVGPWPGAAVHRRPQLLVARRCEDVR